MKSLRICLAFALAPLFIAGCFASVEVGELKEETETMELLGAESVRVSIEMGVGQLKMSGGSGRLLDAEFKYNVEKWKPEIDYEVDMGKGNLTITQPSAGRRRVTSKAKCLWDLKLNEDVPMVLDVNLGASESRLHLGDLNLREVIVNLGAGDVSVDISGSRSLRTLEVAMGAGSASVDLSGQWENDLDATINGGVGECTVIVPTETGVRIDVDKGIGKVNATGLNRDGEYYVNDAYGKTACTMRVNVGAGIGNINLRLEGEV